MLAVTDSPTFRERRPEPVAVPTASNADRQAVIEHEKQAEREAALRLRQLMRESDQRFQDAVGRLAQFDAMLDSVKSVLRRDGYLR